jgi:uncharacterized protein involved in exopolysaccharide biosynthesis
MTTAPAGPITLTELLTTCRSRWRVLAAAVAVGTVLGALAAATAPTTYRVVAVVQVESPEPDLVDMAAEEAVATSRRVTAEALATLPHTSLTIEQLEDGAAAQAVGTSRVLHVTFAAADPAAAARGANALAQAYLAARAVDAAAADGTVGTRPLGRVVDPARRPSAPVGPGRSTWVLGGSLLGLLLGVPAVATRTRAARAS